MPSVVQGEVTPQGFADLVSALTQSQAVPVFAGIRIKDDQNEEIETLTPDTSSMPLSDPTGTLMELTATFSAAQVTSDVHSVELVNPSGEALVTSEFSPPMPGGQALSITMLNQFLFAVVE